MGGRRRWEYGTKNPGQTFQANPGDEAPSVALTDPLDDDTDVATAANITITFSEAVDVAEPWFTIDCADSGPHAAAVSGGPTTFTLDPAADFSEAELCTVTVLAAGVTDVDADNPPDVMAADVPVTFTVGEGGGRWPRSDDQPGLRRWRERQCHASERLHRTVQRRGDRRVGRRLVGAEYAGPDRDRGLAGHAALGRDPPSASTTSSRRRPARTPPCRSRCRTPRAPSRCGQHRREGRPGGQDHDTAERRVSDQRRHHRPRRIWNDRQLFRRQRSGTDPTSDTTAALRLDDGATDTDDNAADFVIGVPNPRPVSKEPAPFVSSTSPPTAALGVAKWTTLTVNFSEPVNVTGAWFTIGVRDIGGTHTVTVAGANTTFLLDPTTDFTGGESCTLTVVAANVTDQDADDPPDTMAADHVVTFTVASDVVCGAPATFIHDVQGDGLTSPITNQVVEIQGVVIGAFPGSTGFQGLHVQEEDADADADPATSEGIFFFDPTAVPPMRSVTRSVCAAGSRSSSRAVSR